eukprot:scaffold54112_cov34-Phaeocystis_antarctica.AAC.1
MASRVTSPAEASNATVISSITWRQFGREGGSRGLQGAPSPTAAAPSPPSVSASASPRGVITSGLKVHGGVAAPAEGGECGS